VIFSLRPKHADELFDMIKQSCGGDFTAIALTQVSIKFSWSVLNAYFFPITGDFNVFSYVCTC